MAASAERSRRSKHVLCGILGAAGLAAVLAGVARADDVQPAPAPSEEKTVYVPYENLEDVFEKQGRGVYLPYEEFIDLWRKGVEPKTRPAPAPVPGVIEQALYEGTVEGDAARILGTLDVSVLADGWSRIPLAVGRVGLESVSFPEVEPGDIVLAAGDQGLELLARKAGRYKAVLRFTAPVSTEPGLRALTFPIPASSVTRLDLRIPDADVAVEVEPAVATTVAPNAAGETGTHILAVIGVAPAIRAQWRPRVEEAAREPMAFADVRALLRVRAGFLRSEIAVDYKILQAPLGSFELDLPEGYALLSVTGDGIRDWKLDGRALSVTLYAPVRDAYSLALVLERALAPDETSIVYPGVGIRAAQRETGTLLTAVAPGLKVKAARAEGLTQIDVSALPAPKDEALVIGYRYLRPPYALDLAVEKVTPRIEVQTRAVL
ncbi:MAG: hypothetical protein JXP34_07120, partial [Planctomycetes bacterium]|nr:hypothetical protein [Planctomycetota bacterium]